MFKRTSGPASIVDDLAQRLLRRWVPKWYGAFRGGTLPLFYERLGPNFKPILTERRRLLSQFRQLAMYSHAAMQPEIFLFDPELTPYFESIVRGYKAQGPGAWLFALDDSGRPADRTLDLYGHAFAMFALANYGRATGDNRARDLGVATAKFVNSQFRKDVSAGFTEALGIDGKPLDVLRRHESHMHFLEGCLFAYESWGDDIFKTLADEMVSLFFTHFFAPGYLSEFFTTDLKPAPDLQRNVVICEPGHYYEWIWLLKKHAAMHGEPARYDATCLQLLDWANTHGWDSEYGGIYDELEIDGTIVTDTKRLWPYTEALKANAMMLDVVADKAATKERIAEMTLLFRKAYMHERGFWTEWLNRDLSPVLDYMPATTPYHVYFGIMEARAALAARGPSKSLARGPLCFLYGLRRKLSALMARFRPKTAV